MNTSGNSDPQTANFGLHSHEDLSGEVRDIWGDDRMRESIRDLVRVGVVHISTVRASITPSFDVFNRSHNTEPQIWNLWQEWEVGKTK